MPRINASTTPASFMGSDASTRKHTRSQTAASVSTSLLDNKPKGRWTMKRYSHVAWFLLAAAAIGCGGVSSPGGDDDDDDDVPGVDAGVDEPEAPVLLSSSPAN